MKGYIWIDTRYNIVYFTPLGEDKYNSVWLGTVKRLRQYLSQEVYKQLQEENEVPVDLDLV